MLNVKLDTELKAKWVAALRSGEFRQGKNMLCRLNEGSREYCCLGVLAEIAGSLEERVGSLSTYFIYKGNGSHIYLSANGESEFMVKDFQDRLATMNDDGLPFTAIANFIEASTEI